jgi:hypothetical protein
MGDRPFRPSAGNSVNDIIVLLDRRFVRRMSEPRHEFTAEEARRFGEEIGID